MTSTHASESAGKSADRPRRLHRLLAAIGMRPRKSVDEEELTSAILGTVVGSSAMVAASAHGTLGSVQDLIRVSRLLVGTALRRDPMHIARRKITPPTPPVDLVDRPVLLEALDRGDDRALTLISAPAGFGKSLLLADWRRSRADTPTAWLTLDPDDADPRRFWAAVLAALVECPGVPPDSRLHWLVVSRTTVELDFLADLIDAVGALPHRIRLILDDAHNLASRETWYGLQMLMSEPSRRLRLILSTRRDPGLAVARMRLEEQLCELRAEQLRFTAAESSLLLDRHGIRLDAMHRGLLDERTGGWPAGFRLAVRQLLDHPDPCAFVASFSGNERPVADYLICEVLEHISDDEREVLRLTSICDPIPGRLAAALSGRENAAELLDRLEHDTGVVAGIDQHRSEYRVEQLVRSYLVADLARSGVKATRVLRPSCQLVQCGGSSAGRASPCRARRRPCAPWRAAPSMGS